MSSGPTIREVDGVAMLVGIRWKPWIVDAVFDEDVVWLPTEARVREIIREELTAREMRLAALDLHLAGPE